MAERSRSRSAPSRAWSMSAASVTRSMATAAWLPTASSSAAVGEASSPAASLRQHADHADRAERLVRIGTNSQRPPGRVSVPRRSAASASHDQRAAARSASLEIAVGRKAARSASLPCPDGPSSGIRIATSRVQQPGQMGDHDPQQVVEVDDARDLAAEGIELGGGAGLAPGRLGLGARARGQRARHDRHDHEEEQRQQTLAGSGMVNL